MFAQPVAFPYHKWSSAIQRYYLICKYQLSCNIRLNSYDLLRECLGVLYVLILSWDELRASLSRVCRTLHFLLLSFEDQVM
jgi:hypothetical protein